MESFGVRLHRAVSEAGTVVRRHRPASRVCCRGGGSTTTSAGSTGSPVTPPDVLGDRLAVFKPQSAFLNDSDPEAWPS